MNDRTGEATTNSKKLRMKRASFLAITATAFTCLTLVGGVSANPLDGHRTAELAAACASSNQAERNICHGFILGAGQLYLELLRAEVLPNVTCADPVPTIDEIGAAFADWVEAHPEYAETRAIDGFMQAAVETWPCE